MIEHLPPDSPWLRGKRGGWSDLEWLLWNVESRVREAITQQANMWRREGTQSVEPTYLPAPSTSGPDDGDVDESAAERAELVALLHR